jgi:hypothetical protein
MYAISTDCGISINPKYPTFANLELAIEWATIHEAEIRKANPDAIICFIQQ